MYVRSFAENVGDKLDRSCRYVATNASIALTLLANGPCGAAVKTYCATKVATPYAGSP